ncbi:exopolysaccharide Pel transporter PelG [Sphingobium estronivorans]|uniref:exopolysaccharide Pel transporter PelG n=1 Tax=Sphingobium estronivorans TaxID=1577690 RepID=UPI00123848AB|nr:exopolysaccharide Pel transporter PelG [Sphingobium estronivorans]
MAGIGFRLDRIAREDGLGGIASAAFHGAVVSSGPWLMTAFAIFLLQGWTRSVMQPADHAIVQASLVYAFGVSTVITAPLAMIATRMASDRFYLGERNAIPPILMAALVFATIAAQIAGNMLFGFAAAMRPDLFLLATAILTLFAQIWIASPFLHATWRHRPIFLAYVSGIAMTAVALFLIRPTAPEAVLAAIAAGLIVTLALLIAAIREDFPGSAVWRLKSIGRMPGMIVLGAAGLANALAIWIDKWLLWWAPGSVQAVGALRVNPINDQASFLGLLTMIPGLTLILVTTETRFDRVFADLMAQCMGTANRHRIEKARRKVGRTIRLDLRLLMVEQAILACFCWVLAPEIIRLLDLNARAIFGFRLTALGVVFHLVAIQMSIILSYYDLSGRIVAVWGSFMIASAIGTLLLRDAGFAGFGFGYLAGAVTGASLAVALVMQATGNLTYLLFVGNNPAVVGNARFWP